MQVHQRDEREGLRPPTDRVRREQGGQADGLVRELPADRVLGVMGEVALREQQVEDGEHRRQAGGVLRGVEGVEVEGPAAQPGAGPGQALVDVGLAREEPERDLAHVEAGEDLQSQHELRSLRDRVIAAHEEHAEKIVLHLPGEGRDRLWIRG